MILELCCAVIFVLGFYAGCFWRKEREKHWHKQAQEMQSKARFWFSRAEELRKAARDKNQEADGADWWKKEP